MSAILHVLRPGLHTTVQDFGRFGFQELGVPVAGALDMAGLRLANALAGNRPGEACLEISYLGPTLRVEADSLRLAVCGAVRLTLSEAAAGGDRRVLESDRSHRLGRGDILEVGAVSAASVAYLAVAGGFDLVPVMGSLSTYVRAGLGPLDGKPLACGTVLPLCAATAGDGGDLALPEAMAYGDGPIRVMLGPQQDSFTEAALATFLSAEYVVSKDADRMGLRLEGPRLDHRSGPDIASDGLVNGCIQVPGNGGPIVLLADHQTTGGYAKIATVISADLPRLGRAMPGTRLTFTAVTADQAAAARLALEREIGRRVEGLRPPGAAPGIDLAALYGGNLVSGMVDAIPDDGR